jgi:uncharacterized ferritin-like protein (DUF455 family)
MLTVDKSHPKIKGLELSENLSDAEIETLWGDVTWLRPKDHVAKLRHFISLEFALTRLLAAWVPACGSYEWKTQIPQRMHEDMQHIRRLRERLRELPGGSAEIAPSPALAQFIAAVGAADSAESFLSAFYFDIKRDLLHGYQDYRDHCDPIFDAPTIYILEGLISEKQRQLEWAASLLQHAKFNPELFAQIKRWREFVRHCLNMLGGVANVEPAWDENALPPSPVREPAGPAPHKPKQDPRFKVRDRFPLNKQEDPVYGTLKDIVYQNATEWQVIDPMCYIFYGIRNMPLDFFVDFSRHIWDECRHSLMGLRRLRELGYDIQDFHWPHYGSRLEALEDYFAELTMVGEACSFTRKKGSIAPFLKFNDPHSAMLPEIDCVDERLHVRFGRQWLPVMFKNNKGDERPLEAIADSTRLRLAQDWTQFQGLSEDEREKIARSFAGFCTTIEFALDFTVYD